MSRALTLVSLAAFVLAGYAGVVWLAGFWGLVVVGVEVRIRLLAAREKVAA